MRTIGSKYLNPLELLNFRVRFSDILRTYDVAPHTQDNQPGMGSQFSAKTVKQKEQPSIRHKLDQEKAQSKAQHKEKVKVKTKDRGVEL